MIKLKPGFHMIATIAVIAAIAEKKKNFSDRSDHMKPLSSDPSDNNLSDRLNFFFSAIAAITAIIAITWKPAKIYRNNHPPFLLNCYLYTLQLECTLLSSDYS